MLRNTLVKESMVTLSTAFLMSIKLNNETYKYRSCNMTIDESRPTIGYLFPKFLSLRRFYDQGTNHSEVYREQDQMIFVNQHIYIHMQDKCWSNSHNDSCTVNGKQLIIYSSLLIIVQHPNNILTVTYLLRNDKLQIWVNLRGNNCLFSEHLPAVRRVKWFGRHLFNFFSFFFYINYENRNFRFLRVDRISKNLSFL